MVSKPSILNGTRRDMDETTLNFRIIGTAKELFEAWFDVKKKYGGGLPWDKNGYSFNSSFGAAKDGKPIDVPMCRECTSQPRCSKWKGNYPYDKQEWFMREQ